MRRVAAGVLLAASLAGCASAPEMKMTPAASGAAVGVRYSRGEAFMLSGGENGAVMLTPLRYNGDSRRTLLLVAAYNRSGVPINFGPENVRVVMDTGAPLPLYDFDQLRSRAKASAQAARLWALFDAIVTEFRAAQIAEDDPRLARRISAANASAYDYQRHSIADNLRHQIRTFQASVLDTTTIDPGTYWRGGVIADQPPLAPGEVRRITVAVEFAGEAHRFNLFLAPQGTSTPPQVSLPAVTHADSKQALHGTRATWLWDAPVDPYAEQPKVISVRRF